MIYLLIANEAFLEEQKIVIAKRAQPSALFIALVS